MNSGAAPAARTEHPGPFTPPSVFGGAMVGTSGSAISLAGKSAARGPDAARRRPPGQPLPGSKRMVNPQPPVQSVQSRNAAHNRRNAMKVEQYLTQVERAHGFAKAWELRERFERGDTKFGVHGGN